MGRCPWNTKKYLHVIDVSGSRWIYHFLLRNHFQVGKQTFEKDSVFGTNIIVILAIVFLASAAMWMPSLIAFIRSGEGHWWVVCTLSLWVTAISVLLMTGVKGISHVDGISKTSINASVAGLACTTFHCLFLDAMVWITLYNK